MYIYIDIKYKVILTSFNLSRFLNTLNRCFSDGIPAIFNQDFESLITSSNKASTPCDLSIFPVLEPDINCFLRLLSSSGIEIVSNVSRYIMFW